jgi:acyl-CoA thioesterase-1
MKAKFLAFSRQLVRHYILIFPLILIFSLGCKKQESTQGSGGPSKVGDAAWLQDTDEVSLPFSNHQPIDPSLLAEGQNSTIVVLGSSTAAGVGASSANFAWVELLKFKLRDDSKNVNVVNLGIGGSTTFDIMPTGSFVPQSRPAPNTSRNITTALSFHPFLIIINMPTNDVATNYTDEEILANYNTVCSEMDSAHVNYIITGTQPRNLPTAEQRTRLLTLNDKLLKAYPNHVVDILTKLSKSSYYISDYYAAGDGIHLNNRGHRVIFGYIFKLPLFQQLLGYSYYLAS